MANAIVPWPGPVPAPGPSNVMMVGAGRSWAGLLKIRMLSIAPPDASVAEVPRVGLTACAVCDSASQAKRPAAGRKTCDNVEYLIGAVTQGIIVDLR